MDVLWEPLRSDEEWWGLYTDGYLTAVIHWRGEYQPTLFDFNCFLSSEVEYVITEVRVTPI